jgi:hypothetical protein
LRDRAQWQLIRIVDARFFGVFDPVETFFFDGRYDNSIAQQTRRGLMVGRVDSKDVPHE